jgi:hypothetical protein
MRYLKDGGQFVFKKEEYLTGQQISSYFSRLALKDRNVNQEDYKSAEEEKCKRELKSDILKHFGNIFSQLQNWMVSINITHKHKCQKRMRNR